MMVFDPPAPVLAAIWVNGVDSGLFRCGSVRSTLVPCGLSATSLSCAVEFLKRSSNLDCIAHELSAWSLLIVSILVFRFHNFSFTVSYRCFISCISFLIYLSRSLSVASTFSDICCSFSSVALARFSFLLYRIGTFVDLLRCTSIFCRYAPTLPSSLPAQEKLFFHG